MATLYLVGLGPGTYQHLTAAARAALDDCDVLVGYTVYIDLVRDLYPDKETYTTPMTREIERCQWAVDKAAAGTTVAMLCSGDAGVYGMAGLVLELAEGRPDVDVQVVPGITAALSGAAVLGAPLMNDFCVISLSDLLTPWDDIARRLECAAIGDFSVAIYNPSSKKRADHLQRACDIMLKHKPADTVCGWVKNIGRDGQEYKVMTLEELRDEQVDMFTTVFVGTRATKVVDGRMVTMRGYEKKR